MNKTDIKVKFCGVFPYPSYQPTKQGDAGLDLRSQEDLVLKVGEARTVKTGLSMAIPLGVAGFVCSRSGLAARNQVTVLGAPGIVDSGYRGEICATLINQGKEDFVIKAGDRIAQLLLVSHIMNRANFVSVEELDKTERGDTGFGSSGV